jgi:hypothetical protein
MAHPSDAVLDFIQTTLTGLSTTGSNVFRTRVYDIPDANIPAITISIGSDTARGDSGRSNIAFIDSDLIINLNIKVKSKDDLDGALTDIREEIFQAFKAAYDTRLASILDYWEIGAAEPETFEADTKKADMLVNYNFAYRRAQ